MNIASSQPRKMPVKGEVFRTFTMTPDPALNTKKTAPLNARKTSPYRSPVIETRIEHLALPGTPTISRRWRPVVMGTTGVAGVRLTGAPPLLYLSSEALPSSVLSGRPSRLEARSAPSQPTIEAPDLLSMPGSTSPRGRRGGCHPSTNGAGEPLTLSTLVVSLSTVPAREHVVVTTGRALGRCGRGAPQRRAPSTPAWRSVATTPHPREEIAR